MALVNMIFRSLLFLVFALLIVGCHSYLSPEASKAFKARVEPFSVSVHPVNVIRPPGVIQPNTLLAERVVAFLATQGLARPVLSAEPVVYDFLFSSNQAKIVAHSAKAFAAQVKAMDITTDYALLVEIMMLPNGMPGGVHYYLSDPEGALADGSFTNDHWDEFKTVQPKTPDDGYEVAIRMLQRTWGE
jgi:hypothetical protein